MFFFNDFIFQFAKPTNSTQKHLALKAFFKNFLCMYSFDIAFSSIRRIFLEQLVVSSRKKSETTLFICVFHTSNFSLLLFSFFLTNPFQPALF